MLRRTFNPRVEGSIPSGPTQNAVLTSGGADRAGGGWFHLDLPGWHGNGTEANQSPVAREVVEPPMFCKALTDLLGSPGEEPDRFGEL